MLNILCLKSSDLTLPWVKCNTYGWVVKDDNGDVLATLTPRLHYLMDSVYEVYISRLETFSGD